MLITHGRRLSENPSDRTPLEEFWERHQLDDENKRPSREGSLDTSTSSPKPTMDRSKSDSSNGGVSPHPRTTSTASGFLPNTSFSSSSHHPALAIPIFLDTFGPLVFPLYRAALLRKRILFLCNAPVAEACQFSKFTGIPLVPGSSSGHITCANRITAQHMSFPFFPPFHLQVPTPYLLNRCPSVFKVSSLLAYTICQSFLMVAGHPPLMKATEHHSLQILVSAGLLARPTIFLPTNLTCGTCLLPYRATSPIPKRAKGGYTQG